MKLGAGAIADVDFSDADLTEASLNGASFSNCLFNGADLTSMRQWRVRFDGCEFVKTNFSSASFGADGALYTSCLFERARFSGAIVIRPEFIDCSFLNCNFRGVDFFLSRFIRCKFTGWPDHRELTLSADTILNLKAKRLRYSSWICFANIHELARKS
jgi:uncharacterized protein YjbI with pentapeptide repeats